MFVVAGGDVAPILDVVEGAFDDVAVLVVLGVEPTGPIAFTERIAEACVDGSVGFVGDAYDERFCRVGDRIVQDLKSYRAEVHSRVVRDTKFRGWCD